MKAKSVKPAVLGLLIEALVKGFWYKSDLADHLQLCIPDNRLLSQLDWKSQDVSKRDNIKALVKKMASNQIAYGDDLVALVIETSQLPPPTKLKKLDGGQERFEEAVYAIGELRKVADPYLVNQQEKADAEKRRDEYLQQSDIVRARQAQVHTLKTDFAKLHEVSAQKRGYDLEAFLTKMFTVFVIDVRGPFRIKGEQIDGAFVLDGVDYLIEAKWQDERTPTTDLSIFDNKVGGKLDNTLGVFISINGYQETAINGGVSGRPRILLFDGADLAAVLENRITLPDLIRSKRQHAAQTGEIFISAFQVL